MTLPVKLLATQNQQEDEMVTSSKKKVSNIKSSTLVPNCSYEVARLLEKIESRTDLNGSLLQSIDARTDLHTDLLNDIKTNLTFLSIIAENTGHIAKTMENFREDSKENITNTISNFKENNKPLLRLVNSRSVPLSIFVICLLLIALLSVIGISAIMDMNVKADRSSFDIKHKETKDDILKNLLENEESRATDEHKEILRRLLESDRNKTLL